LIIIIIAQNQKSSIFFNFFSIYLLNLSFYGVFMTKFTPNRTALGSVLVSALAIQPMAFAAETAPESITITGQEVSILEQKDTTATKMDVSLKDLGRSVAVINSQQIEDLAANDVSDLFKYVAGFNTNDTADRRYISRGLETNINNLLVDGLRTLQGSEAGSGSRFPSAYNIESVSFLRGPAGILNGESSGGGLISVTTKQPEEAAQTTLGVSSRSYMSSDTGYGERNSASVSLDSTGPVGDSDVLYRVIVDSTPSGKLYQDGRDEEELLIDGALTFKLGDNTKLTADIEYTNKERTGGSSYGDGVFSTTFIDGSLGNTTNSLGKPVNREFYYGSPDDYGENKAQTIGLKLEHDFNDDWSLVSKLSHTELSSEALDLYVSNSFSSNVAGATVLDRKWVYANYESDILGFDTALQGKFDTGSVKHHVVTGVSYRDINVKFDRNFQSTADATGQNTISISDPDDQVVGPIPDGLLDVNYSESDEQNFNLYVKDRISVGDFIVSTGLGYIRQDQSSDSYNGHSDDIIWDAGALYSVNKNLNVFATYSRSYDPVSISNVSQYGVEGKDYVPVEGVNLEVGAKSSFFNGRVNSAITAFNLEQKNTTSRETIDGVSTLIQDTDTSFRSQGVELDLQLNLVSGLVNTISYAYTRAADTSGDDEGKQANNTPKHSLAIWNSYQFTGAYSPIRLALGFHYEGDATDGSDYYDIPSYYEFDLGAYYETKDWDLGLTVNNVLDENAIISKANGDSIQPNDPRSLNLSFKYRL